MKKNYTLHVLLLINSNFAFAMEHNQFGDTKTTTEDLYETVKKTQDMVEKYQEQIITNAITIKSIFTDQNSSEKDYITSLGWSPDSQHIVFGKENNKITKWNLFTGNHYTFDAHEDSVLSVSYSHDGNYLLSTADDQKLKVWHADLENYTINTRLVRTKALAKNCTCAVYNPDDTTIALSDVDGVASILSNSHIDTLGKHAEAAMTIDWSSNGEYIASGSDDGAIGIYSYNQSTNKYQYAYALHHNDIVESVQFSPSSNFLISASSDTVKLWNFQNEMCIHEFSSEEKIKVACWSPNEDYIAIATLEGTLYLCDIETRSCKYTLNENKDMITDIAWSPDANFIAVGTNKGLVKVWDVSILSKVNLYNLKTTEEATENSTTISTLLQQSVDILTKSSQLISLYTALPNTCKKNTEKK